MRVGLLAKLIVIAAAAGAYAAPPVGLEVATEPGLQITAPQEWLQLLTRAGIDNVRIRAATGDERPRAENIGSDQQPHYRVVGVLTSRGELHLPGRTFRRGDLARLKEYLQQVAAEGPDAVIAPRGRFGLTESQFAAVLANLAQPIDFPTEGQPPHTVVDRLAAMLSYPLTTDTDADRALRTAGPLPDELQGLTTGTGLAILLHGYGLALRPEKTVAGPVVLRVEAGGSSASTTTGEPPVTTNADAWPVGWDPDKPPVALAPTLFESVNVAIDGYTLRETLEAIGPRIKVPYYWDHAALAADQIDPDAVKVSFPNSRMSYKRLLDRVLAQSRLGIKLRVDEAGTAFLWITR
jgi:hypothetical protein